uniref:Uncharacterized protein n=1 Tax=Amphimedon queenslandica TaxID=400682 RepID=A0A1X7UPT9_AMPQE
MSGDEERENGRKKKYNSFIRPSLSKYADEWKQTYGIEKDLVNLHQPEGYQSTACQIMDKSNAELLKIQSQVLYETPENVKSKDKDSGTREKECVTECIGACSVVTDHSLKNCQETVIEVSTSKREDNGHYRYPTREEKLEALWIKENGNVVKDHVHSSPGLPLVCQLMNTLRQALLLCSVSDETCQRPLLHVNSESDLAFIIMEGLKELACKNDQSAIDRLQHILKESLAISYEVVEEGGEDDDVSSYDAVQFLKALLDVIACMGRKRKNDTNELTFDKNSNNLRNSRRPALLDDNVIHKRYNIEIFNELVNSEIIGSTSEKKGREDMTALQLKFKEERVEGGILSAIAIKEGSLLLKEMKVFASTSATTSGRGGGGGKKKKMNKPRLTKQMYNLQISDCF